MPLHVSSTFAHHQEVKIALHSFWYQHTYRWPFRAQVERGLSQPVHGTAIYMYDDTRGCVMQFWPPDDEHVCSKHVQAWNKFIVKQNFCVLSWLITEINYTNKLYDFRQTGLLYKEASLENRIHINKKFFSHLTQPLIFFNISTHIGRKRPSWATITKYFCTGSPMMVVIHRNFQIISGRVPRKKDVLFYISHRHNGGFSIN